MADCPSRSIIDNGQATLALQELQADLLLLGSKPVIEGCNRLDTELSSGRQNLEVASKQFDSLQKSIRRDLGHHNIYEDLSSLLLKNLSKRKDNSEYEKGKSQSAYN